MNGEQRMVSLLIVLGAALIALATVKGCNQTAAENRDRQERALLCIRTGGQWLEATGCIGQPTPKPSP